MSGTYSKSHRITEEAQGEMDSDTKKLYQITREGGTVKIILAVPMPLIFVSVIGIKFFGLQTQKLQRFLTRKQFMISFISFSGRPRHIRDFWLPRELPRSRDPGAAS